MYVLILLISTCKTITCKTSRITFNKL